MGLIHGSIDGLKINYCLCHESIVNNLDLFDSFFANIRASEIICEKSEITNPK